MREKLNDNPLAQVAVIGVLLLAVGFFVMSTMGGGGSKEEAATETVSATATTPEGTATVTAEVTPTAEASTTATVPPGTLAKTAPPPPRPVTDAFKANRIVVLLFVRNGGIDDRMVTDAVEQLEAFDSGVASFVVPADDISRYAAITEGVNVERVPALVVVRPKKLDQGNPSASVTYGYQTPDSVAQAVVDAGYKGPTLDYHP
jgi:hypothetical protein